MSVTARIIILVTMIMTYGSVYPPPAESSRTVNFMNAETEAKVKAAFIFNFTRFVSWKTKKADTPLRIAIFGSEKISKFLTTYIEEKNLSGAIAVISYDSPPLGSENINLLFIDHSKERFSSEIIKQLAGKDILTVSDIEDFAVQGGIIGMYNESGRIKLAINLTEANKSGLKISAKLLELARVIK